MTLTISILISVLLAENICVLFYFRTRPDRAIRLAEKEKHEFLKAAALKLLNRAWGVQGAPAMDDEFDDVDETPGLSNRAIEDLMPDEAQDKIEAMDRELESLEDRKHSEGPVARRRKLVGDRERLRRHLEANPPKPKVTPGEAPYIGTLDADSQAHLENIREN